MRTGGTGLGKGCMVDEGYSVVTVTDLVSDEGTIVVFEGIDEDGTIVTFAADHRMAGGVKPGLACAVEQWAILSRRAA